MRSIEIEPAIVLLPGSVNASAAPAAVTSSTQPIQAAGPSQSGAVPAVVAEGDTRQSDPDVGSSPGEYSRKSLGRLRESSSTYLGVTLKKIAMKCSRTAQK